MPQSLAAALPLLFAVLALEAVLTARRSLRGYDLRDTLACLAMGAGNLAVTSTIRLGVLAALFAVHELAPWKIPWIWWSWLLVIVIDDLCFYVSHRLHHTIPLLWAAHVPHHSSRRYNFSVALRQSWTTPITTPLFWIPLVLLGFDPLMILLAEAGSAVYQFWLHTELGGTWGAWGRVLNTPSHHRVHHGRNPEYRDRNFGAILIVWDRWFKTFTPERNAVDYGVLREPGSHNPLWIAFHEWVALARDVWRARGTRPRLALLFGSRVRRTGAV